MADGGLAAMQAQGGPGYMLLGQQCVQGQQQIQIDSAQIIHKANSQRAQFEFPLFQWITKD
ncbi:hypothetical protein D3C80_2007340 [compost metagenome]